MNSGPDLPPVLSWHLQTSCSWSGFLLSSSGLVWRQHYKVTKSLVWAWYLKVACQLWSGQVVLICGSQFCKVWVLTLPIYFRLTASQGISDLNTLPLSVGSIKVTSPDHSGSVVISYPLLLLACNFCSQLSSMSAVTNRHVCILLAIDAEGRRQRTQPGFLLLKSPLQVTYAIDKSTRIWLPTLKHQEIMHLTWCILPPFLPHHHPQHQLSF